MTIAGRQGMLRAVGIVLSVSAVVGTVVGAAGAEPAVAQIRKGPYLTGLSATGVDVRFELDAPAAATVEVAREDDPAGSRRVVASRANAVMHVIPLTGLEPDARYRYSVATAGAAASRGRFTTAPAPGAATPFTFLVYGDNRSDPAAHAAIVQSLRDAPGTFLVNTGDLVADGASAEDWQSFFDVERPLVAERPIFAIVGNHELVNDAAGANYARYFGPTDTEGPRRLYATARLGIVRFFLLNAMDDWSSGEERAWLEHELTNADAEPGLVWRIAVLHHSPWSVGPHGPNIRLIEAQIPELLGAHGIDLLFAGHDHIYERGDSAGLKYIVTGGGGAPLYRIERIDPTERMSESAYHFVSVAVTAAALRVVATRVDGSLLDRCGFAKRAAWDCDPPPVVSGGAVQRDTPASATSPAGRSRCGCITVGASVAHPAAPAACLLFAGLAARRRRRSRTREG